MLDTIVFNSPLALLAFQDIHNLLFDKQNQNQSHTIVSSSETIVWHKDEHHFPQRILKRALVCEDCVFVHFLSSY